MRLRWISGFAQEKSIFHAPARYSGFAGENVFDEALEYFQASRPSDRESPAETLSERIRAGGKNEILIGSSLGAMLAVEAASMLKGEIQGLILIGLAPRFTAFEDGAGRDELSHLEEEWWIPNSRLQVEGFKLRIEKTPEAAISAFYRKMGGGPPSESMLRLSPDLLLRAITYLQLTDLRETLSKLECPKLLLHGARDKIAVLRGGIKSGPTKGGILRVIPEAPHALPETHPEEIGAEVRQFLSTLGHENLLVEQVP